MDGSPKRQGGHGATAGKHATLEVRVERDQGLLPAGAVTAGDAIREGILGVGSVGSVGSWRTVGMLGVLPAAGR